MNSQSETPRLSGKPEKLTLALGLFSAPHILLVFPLIFFQGSAHPYLSLLLASSIIAPLIAYPSLLNLSNQPKKIEINGEEIIKNLDAVYYTALVLFCAATLYSIISIQSSGGPYFFDPNSEARRLSNPLPGWINFLSSFWIFCLPYAWRRRRHHQTTLIIFIILVSFIYTNNRIPVIYIVLNYIIFQNINPRSLLLLSVASISFLLYKSTYLSVTWQEYAYVISMSQVNILNEYLDKFSGNYFSGYWLFIRPYAFLTGELGPSLADVQASLGYNFSGALVATGYLEFFLDFGPISFVVGPFLAVLIARPICSQIVAGRRLNEFQSQLLFGYTLLFYDNIFNEFYFQICLFLSLLPLAFGQAERSYQAVRNSKIIGKKFENT